MQNQWLKIFALAAFCAAGLAVPAAAQDQSDASQPQDLAAAARKAREQKKTEPPAKQVWTNENIPQNPREEAAGEKTGDETGKEGASNEAAKDTKSTNPLDDPKKAAELEAQWRQKFADANKKLDEDQKELELMERELGLKRQQYFSDPNTALRDQYQRDSGSGGEVNSLVQKIDDQKKKIEDDKQAIEDLEDALRKAGLPAGWSRTP